MVNIVGRGNVACHLCNALSDKTAVKNVDSRTLAELDTEADVTLICVSDRAVGEVAERVVKEKGFKGIVAHTSGSVPLEALPAGVAKGVFYPFQTFSREVGMNYTDIPFFIEGSDAQVEKKLLNLARKISLNVCVADSEKRSRLHLAGVFACNFANRMIAEGWKIMEDAGLPPEFLKPLVTQTVAKCFASHPLLTQTGPARRGDMSILQLHQEMLGSNPELRDIYLRISKLIIDEWN